MTGKDWKKIIEEQERSGDTIASFCREHGLDRRNFSYHKYRLSLVKKSEPELPGEFIQVSGERLVEIRLKNGVELKVPIVHMKAVLEALNVQ